MNDDMSSIAKLIVYGWQIIMSRDSLNNSNVSGKLRMAAMALVSNNSGGVAMT